MDSNIISSIDPSSNNTPGFILRTLMRRWKISEAELCRQAGLPQTTINRLLMGHTADPRANTLRPLANFFGVTVGQLLGDELLLHQTEGGKAVELENIKVPVLVLESIVVWVLEGMPLTFHNYDKWIFSEKDLTDKAFAFKTTLVMEKQFGKGSLLIADPGVQSEDGSFVLVLINQVLCLRRVMKDGRQTLLQPLNSALPTELMTAEYQIVGTILESRVSVGAF